MADLNIFTLFFFICTDKRSPLNVRLPFKYLQTLARWVSRDTRYAAVCTYFPRAYRIRVDLPRFPEFFTRFRRACNYQNRGKKTRSMYAYIFDESIDGEGDTGRDRRTKEFRRVTEGGENGGRIRMELGSVCVLLRQQIWPESEIDLSYRLPWTASSTLREEFNLERNWVIKRAPRLPSIPLSHHPFAQRYDNLRKFIRIETCLASNRSKRRHSSTMNCWEAAIYDYNKDKLLITNQFIGSSNFIVVPAPVVITSG